MNRAIVVSMGVVAAASTLVAQPARIHILHEQGETDAAHNHAGTVFQPADTPRNRPPQPRGMGLDCDNNGVPDEFQPCEDCDGDGLLDSCQAAAISGLTAQYFNTNSDRNFQDRFLVRVEPMVHNDWGSGSPEPDLPSDDFGIRWTGSVTPPATGLWRFYTRTDDGVRLWVDGQLIINEWVDQSATEHSAQIQLDGGIPVAIRMDYYEAGGEAVAELEWEGPTVAHGPIPESVLHPMLDADGNGIPDSCADCNGNGVADALDVLDGTSQDCNANCVPDECDIAPTTPIAYWRFEDGVSQATDSGANGLNGTSDSLIPAPTIPIGLVPRTSEFNDAAAAFGGNGHVLVNDPSGLLEMHDRSFTVEAWVKLNHISDTDGPNQRQFLMQKKGTTAPGRELDFQILVQAGDIQTSAGANSGKTSGFSGRELVLMFGNGTVTWRVTSFLEIDDLDWHHVSVTYDRSQAFVRFTIDDQTDVVPVIDRGHFMSDGPLIIGAHTNASGAFNQFLRGSLDEVRIHEGVLPLDQLLNNGESADCNNNGIPDGCDIASGFSEDCNGDGLPDECDTDCNNNGEADGCDILFGTSQDCNGDGVPDECQLDDDDCDNNGIPDGCQIEAGEDCNGNGILDACDILDGTSIDCQPDGIPDECQLEANSVLAFDDDSDEVAVRADQGFMAWLTRFDATPLGNTVSAIDVSVFNAPISPTVHIWSDPDGDGDPTDALPLWSGAASLQSTRQFIRIPVPNVDVGQSGSFFVGFTLPVNDTMFPALLDTSGSPALYRHWLVGADTPVNPANLAQDAVEFGLIEDILFPGNWLIRAHVSASLDCNNNGIPDTCDVDSGFSEDTDGNGNPDECDDCNSNGTLDSLDIAMGTSLDCQQDGIPDECQIAGNDCNNDGVPDDCPGEAEDCNGNGFPDDCDIAFGRSDDFNFNGVPDECEDCNGNGFLDSEDTTFGFSPDCDGDLTPDECQIGPPLSPVSYALDDGTRNGQVGYVIATDMVWMNQFTVTEGAEWISAVEVAWGNTFRGVPAEVVVWRDPNNDGDPSDAQVLTIVQTLTADPLGGYTSVPIPPLFIGDAGTSFFVGIHYNDVFNTAPASVDTDEPHSGRSWIGENALGPVALNNPLVTQLDPTWDFMVRAVGSNGAYTNDCNANGALDSCDIDAGTSDDTDNDGVPDECATCPCDIDGNQEVDVLDLLAFLTAWFVGDAASDYNNDGSFDNDVLDLLDLLSCWFNVTQGGSCP